jgi:aliphatic nitrilase
MGDAFPKLRLAAVQAAPVWMDRDATVDKACALIREAGENGAQFVGFPENFIPGHPNWIYFHPVTSPKSFAWSVELYKNSVEIPSASTDALCQAAAEANVFVVMGLTERRPNQTGTLFNTQLFIDARGSIVGKHRKLVPTIGERVVHAGGGGDTLRTFPSEYGPVSGLCCGENSNPMAVSVLAAEYTRIHVACWPNHFIPGNWGMPETALMTSQNVAYVCKCFVVSAASVNSPAMMEALPATAEDRAFLEDPAMSGGSAIVAPSGAVIAGPLPGDQEGILYADVDLEMSVRGRLVQDFGGHYNRPDVLRLLVDESGGELVTRHGGDRFTSPDRPVAPPLEPADPSPVLEAPVAGEPRSPAR